jgi:type VI secretion system secreted protein Hcp
MAGNIHIKIETIKGESKMKGYEDQIDIDEAKLTARQETTADRGGGLGAGRVKYDTLQLKKVVDLATPKLFEACSKGTHIPKAELSYKKAGTEQRPYLVVKLEDILITSVTIGTNSEGLVEGRAEGGNPVETVEISFTKIEMEYKEQKKGGELGGTAMFKYDVKEIA